MGDDITGVPMRAAMVEAGLTLPELWLRYFGLGGMNTESELGDHLDEIPGRAFDDDQHDVVVQALNERFMELNLDHLLPYRRA
jgi:hypothetical protein